MADLTITAANVVAGAGAVTEDRVALAAVTAGQVVYADDVTGNVGLADNNSGTAQIRVVRGIALHAAAIGQPVKVHRSGPLTIGATMTAGVAYYLSATPGGICPVADLSTGMFPTILGIATSTTVLNVNIQAAGVAL
jgi:hypothetical protein